MVEKRADFCAHILTWNKSKNISRETWSPFEFSDLLDDSGPKSTSEHEESEAYTVILSRSRNSIFDVADPLDTLLDRENTAEVHVFLQR